MIKAIWLKVNRFFKSKSKPNHQQPVEQTVLKKEEGSANALSANRSTRACRRETNHRSKKKAPQPGSIQAKDVSDWNPESFQVEPAEFQ